MMAGVSPFLAPNEERIGALFEEAMRRSGAVGAQLSLVSDDRQFDYAGGLADARHAEPMTKATLVQIGSITKLFNAAVVVALCERGLLDLDTPVARYLADICTGDLEAWHKITLRHLLSMCSGLDNGPYVYFGSGDDALALYADALAGLQHHFEPGSHFGYSNAGVCLAALAASRTADLSWERLLQDCVLTPSGLEQWALLDDDLRGTSVSSGHRLDEHGTYQTIRPLMTEVRGRAPSGPSFALSARALARFGKAFIDWGAGANGAQMLSRRSIEMMMRPHIATPTRKYGDAWCLGPCTAEWSGVRLWGHGGSTSTSSAYLFWIPEKAGVIAFLVNTPDAMGEFSRVMFDEVLPAAFGFRRPPLDMAAMPAEPFDPRTYVGIYEEAGMRMEVTSAAGNSLQAHMLPRPIEGEQGAGRAERRLRLSPLGADRFLVEPFDGVDPHRGVLDTAFFGRDAAGRATNVLNVVFPMSRVA